VISRERGWFRGISKVVASKALKSVAALYNKQSTVQKSTTKTTAKTIRYVLIDARAYYIDEWTTHRPVMTSLTLEQLALLVVEKTLKECRECLACMWR
jgi:hypothetical protein